MGATKKIELATADPQQISTSASAASSPRILPLFEPNTQPSSWNERMVAGEYAVHPSSSKGSIGPGCVVFDTLAEAKQYASEQVSLKSTLRCRIYDHRGFVGAPICEMRGQQYKNNGELSPRFRRWAGSILFLGGLVLVIVDWRADFSLLWPATLGFRMLIPGLALLVMESMLILHARLKARHEEAQSPV